MRERPRWPIEAGPVALWPTRMRLPLFAFLLPLIGAGAQAQTGPDLSLTAADTVDEVNPGEVIDYTLSYANSGTANATGVTLRATVPAGSTAGANPGWEIAPAGSGIPCDLHPAGAVCSLDVGAVAIGGGGSAAFQVVVDDPLVEIEAIELHASVSDDGLNGLDLDLEDNSVLFATAVFEPPEPLASLAGVTVPRPENLSDFIKSGDGEMWAVVLGKALFWDMQVGSDGVQACASCHFSAGADNRSLNQLNPGSPSLGSTVFGFAGPNFQLVGSDFPLHLLSDPDNRNSTAIRSHDETVSSQGVVLTEFTKVRKNAIDKGTTIPDSTFSLQGVNTRRVEPRNTPTVINAVFNDRNFFDGRAQNTFNGVNPFGSRDPDAKVLEKVDQTTVQEVSIGLEDSSLASQAVGPPLSFFEMSWSGRAWPDIGKKLLRLNKPLQLQLVDPTDSVLGSYSQAPDPGITEKYKALVKRAFKAKWWKTDVIVRVTPSGLEFDVQPPDFKENQLANNEYTQMMYNFSLFFGLAVQMYEATLVSDDTPLDRFLEGDADALTEQQLAGMAIFSDQGRCINCHGGPLLTDAWFVNVQNQPLERMVMGNDQVAVYDNGFYNIGVRPNAEDVGLGGTDPFGLPLSNTGLAGLGLFNNDNVGVVPGERVAVDGAFKTSGLRNVSLTAPYFHNGGQATLRQVVDFYNRGGDFSNQNFDDLDPDIRELGLSESQKQALVAFLLALTDERVEYERAPFDHPQLFIPYGHPGDDSWVLPQLDDPLVAEDLFLEIPAVGAAGGPALNRFLGLVEIP